MEKIATTILLLTISLGAFFRLNNFNNIPSSLNWDEVAIGWNAASIWEAKIDQYGKRWPVSFQSFGDYKAPLLIYITAPFIGVFGLHDWVVRLPIVISSIMSIPLFYFLTKELLTHSGNENKTQNHTNLALLTTLLFSLSYWHIRFSRAAFESTLALFFLLAAILFLLRSLKNHYLYLISGLFFILSLYTYHSPKIFSPLILAAFILIYKDKVFLQIKKHYYILLVYLLLLAALLLPLIRETFLGRGGERVGTLIIFDNNGLRAIDYTLLKEIFNNIITHLSPRFFLYGQSTNFRNNFKNLGIITPVEYILFILGLSYLIKQRKQKHFQFLFFWLIIGLLPGILSRTQESPHTLRSLNAFPSILIIICLGLKTLANNLSNKKIFFLDNLIPIKTLTMFLVASLFLYSQLNFYNEYFYNYPLYSAKDWQFGYKQVALISQKYQDQVDQVKITSYYGQPYLFFAFYQSRNPLLVLWGEMSHDDYLFPDKIDWDGEQFSQNTLLIGSPQEIPAHIPENVGNLVTQVHYPDQEVVFRIVKTN